MNTPDQVGTSVVERGTNGAPPPTRKARPHTSPAARDGEVALVVWLRSGDPLARSAVVRRFHSALVSQASRILRDTGLAEDAVQDAWLAAFAHIDRFNPRFSLFAWLVRIVINRAKSLRRREVRSLPFSAWTSRSPTASGAEELELPVTADDASPERLLLEREALQQVGEAVQALPETQRTVLLLRDFAGASPAEACRALQINDLALRVRLCRARASIRQALSATGMRNAA
ncbi:MAG TPA: sigma-70 family RNA polymerase sigma factor [Myxococcaceae bacterium]|nr:sigma-70 family RNA polymerase sigma factor [Myxococcaceae bacterium]